VLDDELEELPYAEDLQQAMERALIEGQGESDLGIAAAVIIPGYRTWAGAAGHSHANVPITEETLFNVGSVAKSFVAALALQLADEGLLDLDEPISAWLPEMDNVDGRITIRQLLNHSSGLFNVFEHPAFPWVGPDVDYEKKWQLEDVIQLYVLEPYGPPGYAQHYSSTNYLLLTAILERATGESVPSQVERRFLEPLSLDNSFMSMGELPPGGSSVAHPWVDADLDGELEDLSGVPQTWIATMTHPVLYTTPQEMATWMSALYHEQRVLPDVMLEEMLHVPETEVGDPEGGRYGLGVIDFSEILGADVIGHGGSALGYSAAALYFPDRGVSLAWSMNTGESPSRLAQGIMQRTWSYLSEIIYQNVSSSAR
jgi:D-alanyl-D-alanine carboxypeptidase